MDTNGLLEAPDHLHWPLGLFALRPNGPRKAFGTSETPGLCHSAASAAWFGRANLGDLAMALRKHEAIAARLMLQEPENVLTAKAESMRMIAKLHGGCKLRAYQKPIRKPIISYTSTIQNAKLR